MSPSHTRRRLAVALSILAAACGESATRPRSTDSNASCTSGSATALAVGGVSAGLSGSSICLAGGASGAEYALVMFNGSATASAAASLTVTGSGVAAPSSSVLTSVSAAATSAAGLSFARVPNAAFHARLRSLERSLTASMIPAARAARRAGALRLDVIPSSVSVGQYLRLNANANDACTTAKYRTGRVVAISNKAIVVADTGNPAGGYTDAEYATLASDFDSQVDPVDEGNFGAVTDFDGNGHVILFFTKTVNELTPRYSGSYVGGFFFARDLFPTTSLPGFDACTTSNYAEMFYVMVPDPNGTVNGNVFPKSVVTPIALSTVAHEFQHLINASRRMYVNTAAADFEATWLDEGLAHVAEELLFYRQSGLLPRSNLTTTAIRSSESYRVSWNNDQSSNFGRLQEYLASPSANSPYADDDSLATRGATWAFLRYAVDRKSGTDAAYWSALVNSTTTGRSNLASVFGSDVTSLFRDWATSLIADDQGGSDPAYQDPSWHFRSIYDAIASAYPLRTTSLASGATTLTTLGGSAAYGRVVVAGGSNGTLSWGTVPAGVQLSVVRLR